MRYSLAAAALVAGASANYGAYNQSAPVYTTEVLTAYTTYCPYATQVSHNGVTYTVTEATTLTITNCPCTVTKPVYTSPVTYCSTCSASSTPVVVVSTTPKASSSTPVYAVSSASTPVEVVSTSTPVKTVPVATVSSSVIVPSATPIVPGSPSSVIFHNSTIPVATGTAPVGTGSATSTTPAKFTGAANKMAASGASLAGLLGLAAFIL